MIGHWSMMIKLKNNKRKLAFTKSRFMSFNTKIRFSILKSTIVWIIMLWVLVSLLDFVLLPIRLLLDFFSADLDSWPNGHHYFEHIYLYWAIKKTYLVFLIVLYLINYSS